MKPSKANCAKCGIKKLCPLRMTEDDKEFVNTREIPLETFLEFLRTGGTISNKFNPNPSPMSEQTFHKILDKLADGIFSGENNDLPAIIRRINKSFKEKNALDANALSEALINIDQRLNALEAQHRAAKQHHEDKADNNSTKH